MHTMSHSHLDIVPVYQMIHVTAENHLIDWDNVKVIDPESDWFGRHKGKQYR